jgi:hypothetical protein
MAKVKDKQTPSLKTNRLYEAVVVGVDYERHLLSVQVRNIIVPNCTYLVSSLAPLLGATVEVLPAKGSKVLLLYAVPMSYVIGTIQLTSETMTNFRGRVAGHTDKDSPMLQGKAFQQPREADKGEQAYGLFSPQDMYPGELDMSNHLGVAFRVLHNFAQMDAGGLATVETHLLNDLVRIMSNTFAQHTCGGDHLVWGNGYCNDEQHFTGYQYEADGKLKDSDSYAEENEDKFAYDPEASVQGSSVESATGRWRFSRYLGFLGDMVHTFVTNPTRVMTNYHKSAERGGNFRSWIGADGTYMIQAAGGIHLEVRKEIVVPTVFYRWDDPDFKLEEAYKNLDASYLKLWGSGPNWEDLVVSCWQMRYYMRYISQWHSLSRFKQMAKKGYCKVPSEAEAKPNSSVAAEKDKEQANGPFAYKGEASINVTPDGSITIQQGSTTSIVINQGNIQISAPGNIELVAGHTLSLKGKFVSITAGLDLEIASLFGKLTAKARNAFKILSERARVWIKSDAKWFGRKGNTCPEEGGDDFSPFEDDQNKLEIKRFGVVIDAPEQGVLINGQKEVVVHSEKDDVFLLSPEKKVYMFGKEAIHLDTVDEQYTPPTHDIEKCGSDILPSPSDRKGSILIKASKIGVASKVIGIKTDEMFNVNNVFRIEPANTEQAITLSGNTACTKNIYVKLHAHVLGNVVTTHVSSVSGYDGPDDTVNKKDELPAPIAVSDTETPGSKEAAELYAEAAKLDFKKDGNSFKDHEWVKPHNEWKMRRWKIGKSPTYWGSHKRPYYSDAYDHNGYDDNQEFVKVVWPSDARLMGGPRTYPAYGPWPGTVTNPQILCFDPGEYPVLSMPAPTVTSSVISKASDMTPVPYYWLGKMHGPEFGDKQFEVLYKFKSISADTDPAL